MKKLISNCCLAEVIISTADEGTSYYVCEKCNKACDPFVKERKRTSLKTVYREIEKLKVSQEG